MSTTELIIVGLVVVALALAAIALHRRSQSQHLRKQFGPEYGRAIEAAGGRPDAEHQLRAREERVRKYGLRPLRDVERDRFAADWRRIQSEFVDDPRGATAHADDLLGKVMTARGYPEGDFNQRLEDLSVGHATAVQNYREAHDVAERHARGDANTEDMRQAMIGYHTLFDDLVGASGPVHAAS